MQHRTAVLVVAFIVVLGGAPVVSAGGAQAESCEFPMTEVDATGEEVTLDEEPERVVTLAPSAAQTMWEIGAKDKVVGVTEHAAYLKGAEDRTSVSGGEQAVVIERVVDLDPDLVLAPNVTDTDTIDKLREAGVTVFHFEEARTIADVYREVQGIGRLTGECEGAEETVAWMQDRIGTVQEAVSGAERPEAVYLFYGYTAGADTFIHEIIETAGARNLAASANVTGYRQLSEEVIVQRDPDWIIVNSDDPGVPRSDAMNGTTAVKEGQVVVVQIEHLNQPAPRVVHAITKLGKRFHTDAYAAANGTPTPTPTLSPPPETETPTDSPTTTASQSPTETASPSPTAVAETTDPGSPTEGEGVGAPGFGAAAALLALLTALAATRLGR